MLPWQIWLIISGVCFIAEIATVGFLIFWFGVAALITCLLSLFISNVIAQTVIFVILSVSLICLTRPFAEKMNKNDNIVTNSNAIIGKEGVVTKDIWTAISTYTDIIPKGSTIKVLSIDGVKLVVEPVTIKQPEKKI